MVGSHIGAGWTLNLGNPAAWLIVAGNAAALAALATTGAMAGTWCAAILLGSRL